jgi:hypothetical protein
MQSNDNLVFSSSFFSSFACLYTISVVSIWASPHLVRRTAMSNAFLPARLRSRRAGFIIIEQRSQVRLRGKVCFTKTHANPVAFARYCLGKNTNQTWRPFHHFLLKILVIHVIFCIFQNHICGIYNCVYYRQVKIRVIITLNYLQL